MKKPLLAVVLSLLTCLSLAEGTIDIAYSHYTITRPGSYKVVSDLTCSANLPAILISTCNVSIDLNGHTLYGVGTSVYSSDGSGIMAYMNASNISIVNGIVRDFSYNGLYINTNNAYIYRVQAINNGKDGFNLSSDGIIKECIAEGNGGYGIFANYADSVIGNTIIFNKSSGIYANYACVVTQNASTNNQVFGILTGPCTNVYNNTFYYNGSDGINAGMVNIIKDNISSFNSGHGITVDSKCNISGNNCCDNNISTKCGIYVSGSYNTIENNFLSSNNIGISISTTGGGHNFMAGNRFGINYSVNTSYGPTNTVGDGTQGFKNLFM